ncbi:MAG: LytR/AlgR family response regulator transcription factor [Alistipes ihumii]
MNRISTMVVDDEPLAAQLLGDYVRQTPFLSLEGICSSAVEAFSMWQEHPADLLFLDIQMPQMNGLELSRTLGERSRVIFTTAFEQYALEGFRADALDYLLKPISYAEFLRAAGKAAAGSGRNDQYPPASPEAIPAARNLFVRTDYKMQQIRLDDILYIEGMKDYVRIHTAEGGSLVTQTSMKAIEQSLPPDRFVRVHRSYIVQIDRVKTIERNRIVFGKTYIPVSESYKERFMEALSRRSLLL